MRRTSTEIVIIGISPLYPFLLLLFSHLSCTIFSLLFVTLPSLLLSSPPYPYPSCFHYTSDPCSSEEASVDFVYNHRETKCIVSITPQLLSSPSSFTFPLYPLLSPLLSSPFLSSPPSSPLLFYNSYCRAIQVLQTSLLQYGLRSFHFVISVSWDPSLRSPLSSIK